jgi:c(7)-type cytochrome triheme protein
MKRFFLLLLIISFFFFLGVAVARIGGGDIVYKSKKAKEVIFSHDSHVRDVGLSCQQCHPSIYVTREESKPVTMAEMNRGKSCGACHNGKDVFSVKGNCSTCHR